MMLPVKLLLTYKQIQRPIAILLSLVVCFAIRTRSGWVITNKCSSLFFKPGMNLQWVATRGAPATYQRLHSVFAWPKMRSSVTAFVQACTTCQQAKPDRQKYPGLLEPLPVPKQAWQMVSMDFVEGLPQSGRFNCILVVVDKFSKYSHFIPLAHPFSASQVATAYVDQVYKLHGLPSQSFLIETLSLQAGSGKSFLSKLTLSCV